VYRPSSSGVDYTERRKTERKVCECFTSPGVHREKRSFVWERKIFKFLLCHNEWMNERTSFCSFEQQLWTERNLYDGRLHREREKKDWEKSLWMFPHHRVTTERRNFFLREILIIIIIIIFRGFFKFLLNEWMNERITISFVVFGAAVVYRPYGRLHREKKDWEKKVCVNVFPHYITCGPTTQREKKYCVRKFNNINF
jgi:hypothetical protein